MNKFSLRSISAAAGLTAMLAFSANAQVDTGVRAGTNNNISSDVRANAGMGMSGSSSNSGMATRNNSMDAQPDTNANGNAYGPGVRGAVGRTANRAENAVERGARATRRAAQRTGNAAGNAARRAGASIQNTLPPSARGNGDMNVQGSGAVGGQISGTPK